MRLWHRKPTMVKIGSVSAGDTLPCFTVKDKRFLERNFDRLYETPRSIYAADEWGLYEFRKRNWRPDFVKIRTFVYDPDRPRMSVSMKDLQRISETYRTEIFESDTEYIILHPDLYFVAPKEEPKKEGEACQP